MEFAPDLEKAKRIATAVVFGMGDAGLLAAKALRDEQPDFQTLAVACGMITPAHNNAAYHAQLQMALKAPLEVALVEAQVRSQRALSDAADHLARRNYWVATASLIAAGLSLLVSIAQALHWV